MTDMENKKYWYAIQTVRGMEKTCEQNLQQRIVSLQLQDYIFRTLIPEIKCQKTKKDGSVVEYSEPKFPGYIFIEMIVNDDTWFKVRNTPLVTGFLGSSGGRSKPVPVPQDEMNPILKECGVKIEVDIDFKVGDTVEITSGGFKNYVGVVDKIDLDNLIVTVLLDFLGRQTPTELNFNEVKVVK